MPHAEGFSIRHSAFSLSLVTPLTRLRISKWSGSLELGLPTPLNSTPPLRSCIVAQLALGRLALAEVPAARFGALQRVERRTSAG